MITIKTKHEQTNAETVCNFKAERSSNVLKYYCNYFISIHIKTDYCLLLMLAIVPFCITPTMVGTQLSTYRVSKWFKNMENGYCRHLAVQ